MQLNDYDIHVTYLQYSVVAYLKIYCRSQCVRRTIDTDGFDTVSEK